MSVCYTISVTDAKRNKYNLSKATTEKFRFLDIDTFLDKEEFKLLEFDPPTDQTEAIPAQAKPYAALSYVWADLTELPSEAGTPNSGIFATFDLSAKTHPTSVDALIAVCTAARNLGCKNLWMDKLCLRQDNDDAGKADRAWQMQRMYSVYEECKVCLVAAGGMVRLPRLTDRTSWLARAWTLQEALAPAKDSIYCLFTWNSQGKTIGSSTMQFEPEHIVPGVGMAPLEVMLSASRGSDVPTRIDESKGYENDNVILPEDPDSQVYYFGYGGDDNNLIEALQGALDRPNPREASSTTSVDELSGYRLGIWRCITMRYASYSEDFVFATMGIFGVTVQGLKDPATGKLLAKYPPEKVKELLSNYLGVLAAKGARADWFAVAPELGPALETSALPLVPGVNFDCGSGGGIDKPVKSLLRYWDRFSWHLSEALEYKVDTQSQITVTGRVYALTPASNMPAESEQPVIERMHDNVHFRLVDGREVERFGAVVLGHKTRYLGGAFPPMQGDTDGTLLMVVELVESRYKNTGYAWVSRGAADDWARKSMVVS